MFNFEMNYCKAMKFLFILILTFSINSLLAQAYVPFGDSSARWNEESGYCDSWTGPLGWCQYYGWVFDLSGDTIINDSVYNKLGVQQTWSYFKDENSGFVNAVNYLLNFPGEIVGFLREDSTKKVWFRRVDNPNVFLLTLGQVSIFNWPIDTDILIYDFGMHPGDTATWISQNRVLQSIDSLQLENGEWRRLFDFGNDDYNWIEGIGSVLGLFGSHEGEPFENFLDLSCFDLGDSIIYRNYSSFADCDHIPVGIEEVINTQEILLYPNPAHGIIKIELAANSESGSLEIINVLGQCELKVKLDDRLNMIQLHIKQGVYTCIFYDDTGRISIKRLIID